MPQGLSLARATVRVKARSMLRPGGADPQNRKWRLHRTYGGEKQAARLPTMRFGGWDPLVLIQTPVRNYEKIRGQGGGRSPIPRVIQGSLYPLLLYHHLQTYRDTRLG